MEGKKVVNKPKERLLKKITKKDIDNREEKVFLEAFDYKVDLHKYELVFEKNGINFYSEGQRSIITEPMRSKINVYLQISRTDSAFQQAALTNPNNVQILDNTVIYPDEKTMI